jgi:LemA protein
MLGDGQSGGIHMSIAGWVFLAVVVLLLLYVIGVYNRLVRLRALVREGFSGITVQLRRRADLIPNLVEAVKGYATHEREVLDQVTARRADATKASSVEATAQADAQMTSLLGRLMVVAEAYPDLKASQNFQDLQDELSAIEGELQSARRYYNATVRDLNTTVQSFPSVLIARPFGFNEEPFYQDEDPAIQSAPKVSFERPAA